MGFLSVVCCEMQFNLALPACCYVSVPLIHEKSGIVLKLWHVNANSVDIMRLNTVKPLRRDRIGDGMFGPCREIGPISEVSFKFIVCHYNPPHNDRAYK